MKFYLFSVLVILSIGVSKAADITNDKESREIIAVIDTGTSETIEIKPFLCKNLSTSFVDDKPYDDYIGHGTIVTELIIQNLDVKKQCIAMIKFTNGHEASVDNGLNVIKGLEYALKINAKFINMSLDGEEPEETEKNLLKEALDKKIKVVVAAGNDSGKLESEKDKNGKVRGQSKVAQDLDKKCNSYPACYDFNSENFHVVGTNTIRKNEWGGSHKYGNYGKVVKYVEDGTSKGFPAMTGTSMSAAIHMGKWAGGKL